jgi:hypothetical protein
MGHVDTLVGQLYVEERGAGAVLLCWPSLFCDSRTLQPIIDEFARDHRVIVIDGPGHGKSGSSGRRFSLADCADAAMRVLDAMNVERATWIGAAWGGQVGVFAAVLDDLPAAPLARAATLRPARDCRGADRSECAVGAPGSGRGHHGLHPRFRPSRPCPCGAVGHAGSTFSAPAATACAGTHPVRDGCGGWLVPGRCRTPTSWAHSWCPIRGRGGNSPPERLGGAGQGAAPPARIHRPRRLSTCLGRHFRTCGGLRFCALTLGVLRGSAAIDSGLCRQHFIRERIGRDGQI